MKPEELKKSPQFQKLSPEKQAFISEIIQSAGNASGDAMLPLLLKAQTRMKALGIRFTQDESDFLMAVLTSDMSSADRAKFEILKKMMRK